MNIRTKHENKWPYKSVAAHCKTPDCTRTASSLPSVAGCYCLVCWMDMHPWPKPLLKSGYCWPLGSDTLVHISTEEKLEKQRRAARKRRKK